MDLALVAKIWQKAVIGLNMTFSKTKRKVLFPKIEI